MVKNLVIALFVLIISISCKKEKENSILGIWIVKKVQVGAEEMTPISRWMQFNKDSTQSSGNGWLKHSFGTWNLNVKNELRIINLNGLSDESDPFLIEVDKEKMTWKRKEEGQNVQVFLEKTDEKPASPGNRIMGLWKLDSYVVSEEDVTKKENPKNNQTLYLSWDNVFREHNLPNGKRVGVYKIHGHKPELQMVNYGKNPQFSFWKFSITKSILVLTSTDKNIVKKYKRIYKFLQ